jgi:thiamine biosynthesis lipoprotein
VPGPAATVTRAERWEALGTYVHLATGDGRRLDEARRVAEEVLAAVDRTCSRFRPSDLTRANARPGQWTEVDPLLVSAVGVAVEAAATTGGLVDPCLGRTLVRIGYDADLRVVQQRRPTFAGRAAEPTTDRWREIRTDPEGALRVPAGCALDLGATAKAWAADLVAAGVVHALGGHVLVSLGGDVRIDGPDDDPDDGPAPAWTVRVTERPGDPGPAEVVAVGGGGLATSSTLARRWRTRDGERHHLVDPRTGRPTDEHWRTVTATGPTCVAANVATTAALVLGPAAVPWLDDHAVSARLVGRDGSVTRTGSWPTPATTPSTDAGRT